MKHAVDFGRYTIYKKAVHPPQPVDFVIMGVSSGNYTPPKARLNFEEVAKEEYPMAYHFYEAQVNWTKQVDVFLVNAEKIKALALWWDYETGPNQKFYERTANETRESIIWLRERFPGPVGIYTNFNNYITDLEPYGAQFFAGVDLWLANPDNNIDPMQTYPYWNDSPLSCRIKHRQKNDQIIKQNSWIGSKEYGIANYPDKKVIDLNVWNGTDAEFYTWINREEPPPPPDDCDDVWNQALDAGQQALEDKKK